MGTASTTSLNPAAQSGGDAYLVRDIGAAWVQNTAYALGDVRTNGGNAYRCTQAGTSSASGSGPSGTALATDVSDGSGGTTLWTYVGQKIVIAQSALVDASGNAIGTTANPLVMAVVTTTDASGWQVSTIRTGGTHAIGVDVQLKSGPGKLRSIEATHSTGTTLYVGGYNQTAALASGDYPIGRHLSAGNTVPATLDWGLDGYDFSTGLRIGLSSTSITYTAASTPSANTIHVSIRWK